MRALVIFHVHDFFILLHCVIPLFAFIVNHADEKIGEGHKTGRAVFIELSAQFIAARKILQCIVQMSSKELVFAYIIICFACIV